jgi:hypothetical protein
MKTDLIAIVAREVKRRKWSMSELDRRAGVSVGESRRFLAGERTITHPKVEKYLDALGLKIVRGNNA